MKNRTCLAVVTALFLALNAFVMQVQAQNTLNGQYQQLKEESNDYQEFKVIKKTTLDAFWSRVQDSIAVNKRKLAEARKEIDTQKAELGQLQNQLKASQEQMRQKDEAASEVPVLGIGVDKGGYVTFSYFLYAVLLGVLAFFFIQYQRSGRVTAGIRKDYEEARASVDDYKRKLLETQTSLGRELQTERNLVDELKQEITQLKSAPSAR
ncbi:MAG: hypothetical protein MUD08_17525 [Cytophagales bacterium]|jgi:peptidoglycan hydrolase CwlO-like protein|nr:hypothetical protein [Cytophagales bacterium]